MAAMVIVGLVMLLCWCFYRLHSMQFELNLEKYGYKELEAKYEKLQHIMQTRGTRLNVLLSAVTEVVLRVDLSGRVLWGNAQANTLFQLDNCDGLPQSMLVFHRDHHWIQLYQKALRKLPESLDLPEMLLQGRVLMPRLAPLGKDEALLLCLDVTEYVQLQRRQKTLLANLMHDLKTPLTSLLGYARSIEAFADDKALRQEAVTVIANEAKHISDLMNTMLTLEQIEHHQVTGASCNVVGVCLQVWDALRPALEQKNITLKLNVLEYADVAMVQADCQRVLMNVAENAVKFSPEASTVSCSMKQVNGDVVICIQDEGNGIAEQHLARVTERFYRVDDSRSKQQGFGLGLAIVKEILERDSGSLSMENAEAGGLVVRLLIPSLDEGERRLH